jgi:parvulin-like peptidyl-prolyl isomerase
MRATPQQLCCLAVGLALASASACNGAGPGSDGQRRDVRSGSSVGGQVVSTVDGAPITLADVRALVGDGEIEARTALRRLQAERLLAREAARRGMQMEWAVAEVERKAAVQALLQRVADEAVVTDEEVQAAYASQRERFEKPELRAAVHLLAKVGPKADAATSAAARAAVERLRPMLAGAEDLDGFVRTYKRVAVEGVDIICERLPSLPREGRLVKPFADAMFSIPQPGMVPAPVSTSFGWHVIRVVEIVPAAKTALPDALAVLREELLLERRKKRVSELLATLAKTYPVQLSGDAVQSLAALAL